jgi:thioredoxin 1
MIDERGTNSRPAGRRRALAIAVLGLAAAAGAMSYVLLGRGTARAAEAGRFDEADEVRQTLRLGKPTVVEFGANACATCRDMKPVLEALRREHGARISVLDVDILKTRDYIARYRIQLMPTQVFFDAQGREIGRNMGRISGGEILARLGVESQERKP